MALSVAPPVRGAAPPASPIHQPIVVRSAELPWVPSPVRGIERRMLERDCGEVATATSIVRYAPGCAFPRHRHAKGEEYYVLRGVFSDEHGDYPAGCYVRAPWHSQHQPFSREGCEIFVKLRQLPRDATRVVVAPPGDGAKHVRPLFRSDRECVLAVQLRDGDVLPRLAEAHTEALVLSGALHFGGHRWPERTWVRLPAGEVPVRAMAPTHVWIKHTW